MVLNILLLTIPVLHKKIVETAMGTAVNAQTSPNNPYVQAVKTMCYIYTSRKISFWKSNDFLFSFSEDYKTRTEALSTIHNFSKSVIEQRRKDLENCDISVDQVDEFGIKKRTAFLDLLLKTSGNILNDDDVMEEVENFMFAVILILFIFGVLMLMFFFCLGT